MNDTLTWRSTQQVPDMTVGLLQRSGPSDDYESTTGHHRGRLRLCRPAVEPRVRSAAQ